MITEKKPDESTYSYLDDNGFITTIDIATGKRLIVQKTPEDILNDKINSAELLVLESGEEVYVEKGMNYDLLPQAEAFKFSQLISDLICQRIREGGKITQICKLAGYPTYSTICRWKKQNPEFNELLKEAKRDRAEVFMDNVIGIAEDAMDGQIDKDSVAAMRLATEGFEKAAAAGDPAQYGKAKDQAIKQIINVMISTGVDAPIIREVSPEQIEEKKD